MSGEVSKPKGNGDVAELTVMHLFWDRSGEVSKPKGNGDGTIWRHPHPR